VLSWEPAFGLFILVGCGGSLIEELVRRRNRSESSAAFIAAAVVCVLAGAALAAWLG
jgi:hypothetical protein